MDLSERDFNRLKYLKDHTEASSYSEVLKDCIRLYEFILNKDSEGARLYIKENDEEIVRLEFFNLKP